MKLKKVKSSNIVAIGYDARKSLLAVEFNGGVVYNYKEVPPQVYHKFLTAVSKGLYFHSKIRDIYKYEKVEKEDGSAKSV
jgi:hypothetical protein